MSQAVLDPINADASAEPAVLTPAESAPKKPPHGWQFKDVESLWDALDRYHYYHEGMVTRGTDGRIQGGTSQGIQINAEWDMFMKANSAIDRAMVRLGVVEPKLHLLLHHYYRRGLCEREGGWLEAAATAGLVMARKDRMARGAFDWMIERAVWVLFALHRSRRRGW